MLFVDEYLDRLQSTLSGRYTIEHELGAGGMATVYLAHDIRHDRKVAVKVLRPELAAVIGAARFLTEIKVTANLQHPHILPLHDSGEADGFLFYVMPYVEGESLRDRLNRETQLSVEDTLQLTQEIADGLSHAHSLGVIHRDIKPENILLTGGHALIADFGIARAVTEAGGTRLTETGLSLGTPQYMSPEQAAGERNVDARSDVYALGCVTYEMLVGEPPHTGPNAQAIIAKVLTDPVRSIRDSRDMVAPQVDSAIRKALAKLAADRFATVKQFAESLTTSTPVSWDSGIATEPDGAKGRRWSRQSTIAWSLVAVLAFVLVALVIGLAGRVHQGIADTYRLVLDLGPAAGISVGSVDSESAAEADVLAISDDGKRIAFVGRGEGEATRHIYIRDLDQFYARRIPGTESATSPFFAPDGQWLGFYSWSERRLMKVPVSGGTPQVVCACEPILSADWGPDGTIIMDSDGRLGLRVVPATGGEPEQITSRERHQEEDEYAFQHPQFLPGGRQVLFTAWGGGSATRRIAVLSLDDSKRTTLIQDGWEPKYVESGHIVYQRVNELWAVPYDSKRSELTGTPVPVLDSLFSQTFTMLFDISAHGTLVYAPGPVPDPRTAIYSVDMSGSLERVPFEVGGWAAWGPQASPSNDRIVYWGADPSALSGGQSASRIWVYDRGRRSAQAITDANAGDFWPIWAPDGEAVVFASLRGGGSLDLYRVLSDGSAAAQPLLTDDSDKQPYSWLPGGEGLLFQRQAGPGQSFDIWLLRLEGDTTAMPLVEGAANEIHPALSPDGRWLAYASDQSGQYEVYLRRYPELDRPQQVSDSGGKAPQWRADGRELYFFRGEFMDNATTFMRVRIDGGAGTPEAFWSHSSVYSTGTPYGAGYGVTPDGRRLLVSINEQPFPRFLPELRIVFNWVEELSALFEERD
jgi:Tol biopolymer transport system component